MRITTPRRVTLVGAAIAAGTLLAAGPADAHVLYVVASQDLEVASVSGADAITIGCFGGQAQVNGANQLPCTDLQSLEVTVGSGYGDDTVDLAGITGAAFPHLTSITVTSTDDVSLSTDTVHGSQLADVVHADGLDTVDGNGGDDDIEDARIVHAGDGDDVITRAAETADGGPGNDTIVQPFAAVDGGPGRDTVVESAAEMPEDIRMSVLLTDSEQHTDTPDSPMPWTQPAVGIETYEVTLHDGADDFDSRPYSGDTTVLAGGGNDVVRTGPGLDHVDAGAGDDLVEVRDGHADTVDCGSGTDTVIADYLDTVVGCEHVDRPAPQTGVAGPRKVRAGHRAVYRFSSDAPGATYRCRIDHKAFRSCPATYVLRTRKLAIGRHRLQVIAVADGAADPTPATTRVRIVRH